MRTLGLNEHKDNEISEQNELTECNEHNKHNNTTNTTSSWGRSGGALDGAAVGASRVGTLSRCLGGPFGVGRVVLAADPNGEAEGPGRRALRPGLGNRRRSVGEAGRAFAAVAGATGHEPEHVTRVGGSVAGRGRGTPCESNVGPKISDDLCRRPLRRHGCMPTTSAPP